MTLDKLLILNDKSDPLDTPPAGKIYLAYKNGSIQFKDSTGNVSILATGVSPEDVQDTVAGFFTDSASLNVIYDDGAGTLVAEVIQSAIDHTQIANRGTNTHAQLDSHLASNTNPHATTAAQVGADPSGSANAAAAFAVQRANHTGTQLAITISDFNSTVRVVTLNGLTTANSGAIFASDTVISALGKLQGQIGNLIIPTSEDIQDIVGALVVDSASIDAVYNDAGNLVSLVIIPAGIDHTQIANRGTNTHAQLDSHLASNTNPHATTAAQVGADPSGSANAAAAFAVQRANHTGTQAPNTILGFGSEVLATLLTGYTIGTNALVAAADSVLGAIAKLQAQISALSTIVSGQILGDNFQQFLDNTPFSTTSTVNLVAATFTTSSKPVGTYRIAIQYNWTSSSITLSAIFGLYIDGVLVDQELRIEQNDILNVPRLYQFTYASFGSAGTHTIELRVRASAAFTIGVQTVRAEIWRVV